jgi:hypothetical protein
MNAEVVEATREEKGLLLSQSKRIKKLAAGKWLVPSQTNGGSYVVDMDAITCSCPRRTSFAP